MTTDEAQGLITWMAASTSTRLLPGEVTVWTEQMKTLDLTIATQAVNAGRDHWGKFPSWRDFMAVYRSQRRQIEAEREERAPTPIRRDRGAPEWTHVWWWSRNERRPRSAILFPQQGEDPHAMTMEEYEALRQEWIDAGMPKVKHTIPMARSI